MPFLDESAALNSCMCAESNNILSFRGLGLLVYLGRVESRKERNLVRRGCIVQVKEERRFDLQHFSVFSQTWKLILTLSLLLITKIYTNWLAVAIPLSKDDATRELLHIFTNKHLVKHLKRS